ncbi:tRNA-dihydrouridine synthase family protein [Treponema sp. HNW]|uniref:tRNA-dihydrouridine synthase family protein n=1 Tax=Treponema sp. HNW TaxID=3116654 RepID=UPI003D0DAB0B
MIKLLSAPMAAITHEAFRRTIARFGGCDEYYTEMIHAASFINGGPYESYYSNCGPEPHKIVWQLTGSDTDKLVRCAALLFEHPDASSVIGIDMNMGCPAPEIYRQGAGIAWMSKPLAEVEKTVKALRRVCGTKRLSIKIRLGEEDFTEKGLSDFADMLCSAGAERITLHPRTRKESYSRPLRKKYVQLVAEAINARYPDVSVAGNGAIDGSKALADFAALCPAADSFMIGRSAVQKPWIFALLKGISAEKGQGQIDLQRQIDLLKIAEDFIADLEACQPEDFRKTRAQRFFAYYCDNFQFAHYIKSQVLQQKNHRAMLERFTRYFEEMPDERILHI